ncbi:hypothetical protein Zmor_007377 [Zophobas morio]|uniref:Uncharacterized protein n=1 Tax=Zophobas morio TaxID=2755281 RepID=A0AA38MPJ7_9CUCU|nr:hypothetical protein Zmor_007377 [Zophobas morio]
MLIAANWWMAHCERVAWRHAVGASCWVRKNWRKSPRFASSTTVNWSWIYPGKPGKSRAGAQPRLRHAVHYRDNCASFRVDCVFQERRSLFFTPVPNLIMAVIVGIIGRMMSTSGEDRRDLA